MNLSLLRVVKRAKEGICCETCKSFIRAYDNIIECTTSGCFPTETNEHKAFEKWELRG